MKGSVKFRLGQIEENPSGEGKDNYNSIKYLNDFQEGILCKLNIDGSRKIFHLIFDVNTYGAISGNEDLGSSIPLRLDVIGYPFGSNRMRAYGATANFDFVNDVKIWTTEEDETFVWVEKHEDWGLHSSARIQFIAGWDLENPELEVTDDIDEGFDDAERSEIIEVMVPDREFNDNLGNIETTKISMFSGVNAEEGEIYIDIAEEDYRIEKVRLTAGTKPLGDDIVADFKVDGSNVAQLTIVDDSNMSDWKEVEQDWNEGDKIKLDITSIGSDRKGNNLTLNIVKKKK